MADADWGKRILLLECDGTNGSSTFTDISAISNSVTATSATVSTAQAKFGTGSCLIDASEKYLTLPSHLDYTIGTRDFCFEAWIYITSWSPGLQSIFNFDRYDTGMLFRLRQTLMEFFAVGSSFNVTCSSITTGVWHHVAVTRSGTTLRFFLDGVQQGSNQTCSISIPAKQIIIGKSGHDANEYVNGYLDELRISNGTAEYTTNFTPSSVAFDTFGTLSNEIDVSNLTTRVIYTKSNPEIQISNMTIKVVRSFTAITANNDNYLMMLN